MLETKTGVLFFTVVTLPLFLLINCSKQTIREPGMDLRYASVYISKQETIPGLKKLPNWPTDTIENRVLQNLTKDLFLKFRFTFCLSLFLADFMVGMVHDSFNES